jgi:hypothetical protein
MEKLSNLSHVTQILSEKVQVPDKAIFSQAQPNQCFADTLPTLSESSEYGHAPTN